MKRTIRIGLLVALVGALGIGVAPRADAVQSLAYTFALNCRDSGSVGSLVDLPSGTYAVAVTGVCTLDGNWYDVSKTTPCSTTTTGSIPCVGTTVNNVPGQACWTTTPDLQVAPCDARGVTPSSCAYAVHVNGTCIASSTAQITHGGGPMTASYADSYHFDNNGAFTVTVVWTPL